MTVAALLLILISTLLHAGWNLVLKRTRVPDQTAFTLLFLWTATLLFLPVAAWALWRYGMPAGVWPWAIASVAFEAVYWTALTRAYQAGEMSAVYPLARGSGALLASLLGLLVLHEPLTAGVVVGLALIVIGGYVINLPARAGRTGVPHRPAAAGAVRLALPPGTMPGAVRLALLTGLSIGLYSAADKQVTALGAPLLFYFWVAYAGPAVVLTLGSGRRVISRLPETWRAAAGAALLVGACSPVTYLLVLAAMAVAPVSRVAAAREISLVWGALLGRWVLQERVGPSRLVGAGAIAVGVITLALAR